MWGPEVVSTHLQRLGFGLADNPDEPLETGLSFKGFWMTMRQNRELQMTLPGLICLVFPSFG